VRTGWSLWRDFRQSMHILKSRAWRDCDEKMHFESGVHMGVGMFNLVRSHVFH